MILTNTQERTRFLKFAVVGTIGAVVDFGVFNLLTATSDIAAIWASAISFIAAVISNFVWNRYWTYPDSRSKRLGQQVMQFFIVSVIGMGIRLAMFALLEIAFITAAEQILPAQTISPETVGHNTVLALAILVVMFWNFLANRYWTYSDVK